MRACDSGKTNSISLPPDLTTQPVVVAKISDGRPKRPSAGLVENLAPDEHRESVEHRDIACSGESLPMTLGVEHIRAEVGASELRQPIGRLIETFRPVPESAAESDQPDAGIVELTQDT